MFICSKSGDKNAYKVTFQAEITQVIQRVTMIIRVQEVLYQQLKLINRNVTWNSAKARQGQRLKDLLRVASVWHTK